MAKNREPEKPVESETESDDEGDEDSSEDDESSDSDSGPEQGKSQFLKKPLPEPAAPKKTQHPTTPNPQPASSSDDEESGSESDSEEPNPEVKPLASKPMDSPQKSAAVAKLRSQPSAAGSSTPTKSTGSSTPAKSTGAKRPTEEKEMEAKESKRSKKKPEPQFESSVNKSVQESKKQLFPRLWSQDDEIAILEGMAEYAEKKRSDPVADLNAFHDFIKKNLHVDVTRAQLQDKIRRLKKKYVNNKSKEKVGKDKTFSKPHEQKSYELSKIVWGSEKGKETVGSPKSNGIAARKNSNRKLNVVEDGHFKEVKCLDIENDEFTILESKRSISSNETAEERILRFGAGFFEGEKKLEGAREWRKLRQEEVELHLKKLDLLRAQTKLVLDVLKASYQ